MLNHILAAKAGDEDALKVLLAHYESYIYKKIHSYLRNIALAKSLEQGDLYAIAQMQVWKAIKVFRVDGAIPDGENFLKFSKLVYVMVQHAMYDEMVAAKHAQRINGDGEFVVSLDDDKNALVEYMAQQTDGPSHLSLLHLDDYLAIVSRHIDNDERNVLILKAAGYTPKEISSILNLSAQKVSSISHYRLRKKLDSVMKRTLRAEKL